MPVRTIALLPLFALALTACAAQPVVEEVPAIDFAAEEQAVRDISIRWLAMQNAKDAAGIAALFAEDGQVHWSKSEPVLGRAAIQAYLEKDFADNPDAVSDWGTDRVLIAASGDLAIDFGHWSSTGSASGDDHGSYVTVVRKVNGQWMVDTDTSMSATPADEPGGSE